MTSELSEDRSCLLRLYDVFRSNRDLTTRDIRDTLKFFGTINIGLFGASVAAIEYLGFPNPLTLVLAFCAFTVSILGFSDARRNYEHFLRWVDICWNIEELLGLHDETKHEKVKFILPKRYRERNNLDNLMEIFEKGSWDILRERTVFRTVALFFIVFMIISVGLFLFTLSLSLVALWASTN